MYITNNQTKKNYNKSKNNSSSNSEKIEKNNNFIFVFIIINISNIDTCIVVADIATAIFFVLFSF